MKRETKEQCYRELYQAVRETYGADQVSYPEKRINYDFTVTISGLPVEFSLKAEDEMDLLLL